MTIPLVLASRNRGKLAELIRLLEPLAVEVCGLEAFPDAPAIEETGQTFAANATLKAEGVCRALQLPALADDSGLVVDAIGGEPGVRSARYARTGATDAENNALLLERLRGIPARQRTARFVCVLALAMPGRPTRLFQGGAGGRILDSPRGSCGFGYDPLFLSDDLGVTFAEAAAGEKNAVSHRGRALGLLLAYCKDHPLSGR